jgi:hypothetical protein
MKTCQSLCIIEGFINRPFSYVKHCHDDDNVEGQHYSDNEYEQVGK